MEPKLLLIDDLLAALEQRFAGLSAYDLFGLAVGYSEIPVLRRLINQVLLPHLIEMLLRLPVPRIYSLHGVLGILFASGRRRGRICFWLALQPFLFFLVGKFDYEVGQLR